MILGYWLCKIMIITRSVMPVFIWHIRYVPDRHVETWYDSLFGLTFLNRVYIFIRACPEGYHFFMKKQQSDYS